ncbi:MAG: HEAT repeat domain-containing protein [Rhodospirillales bacterium]
MRRTAVFILLILTAALAVPSAGQEAGGPPSMSFDEALAKLATYEVGHGRAALVSLRTIVDKDSASPEKRKAMEAAFIKFLESNATRAGKDQACRHLMLVGSTASVPVLTKMLGSEETADMARYALERIPGAAVDKALRSMLPKTTGRVKIGIINTLGRRKDDLAVPALRTLVTGSDAAVATAAAGALGDIGTPQAAKALAAVRLKTSGAVRAEADDAYLRAADSLAARGDKKGAFAIYKQLSAPGSPEMIRIGALRGLAASGGKDAVPLLAEALKASEPAVQAQAIRQLSTIQGPEVTKLLSERISSADALAKVRIIAALSDRGDTAARPVFASSLKDSTLEVRLAALEGMGRLGGQPAVKILAETAATASEAAEQNAAREALSRLTGEGVDEAVIAGISGGDAKVRVELMRAAAARGIAAATPALLQAARDSDRNVRREALRALRDTAAPSDAEAIIAVLRTAQSADRREAERALSAVLARSESAPVAPVMSAYQSETNAAVRASLLQVMAQMGREESLPTLRGALKDSSDEIRRAGILALSEWPTPAPMPDLLAIAKGDSNPAFQILALRGYIRLVGLPAGRSASATAALLAEAMSLAKQPDEKKAVLALLPKFACPESLKIAEAAMKDASVANEARLAADRLRRSLAQR